MGYTNVGLKDKIMEMYPEINEHGVSVTLDFSKEKKAYVVKLKKDQHELSTHIEKKEADECMDGLKCIHLDFQIRQFIDNFAKNKT
ncbi:MAG: hypothetical protein HZC48_01605 [Nitrospirae bacterium]|nr:hypothetical protein [Nitrospirota bacterium]